jgi:hypothetical protein
MNYCDTLARCPDADGRDLLDPLVGSNGYSCWTLAEANKPEEGDYLMDYKVENNMIHRFYYKVLKVTPKYVYINWSPERPFDLPATAEYKMVRLKWNRSQWRGDQYNLMNTKQRCCFSWYVKEAEFPHFPLPDAHLL